MKTLLNSVPCPSTKKIFPTAGRLFFWKLAHPAEVLLFLYSGVLDGK